MRHRRLGPELTVSAIGLGCMGMSHAYGGQEEAKSIATLRRAIDIGVTFLDTAEVYGPFANEALVGKAIAGRRDEVTIATKFGFKISPEEAPGIDRMVGLDGRPENARKVADASLKRLGVEVIDLYYLHRVDPAVPVEESVGAMGDLVRAGKVRYIGLSEADAATIRRAHKEFPITALQSEYSLWTRGVEAEILPTLPRAEHRLRAVLAARPRLPGRQRQQHRGPRRQRFPPPPAALPGRRAQGQCPLRRDAGAHRKGARRHQGATGAGLGAGQGRGHRADPRHPPHRPAGGERGERRGGAVGSATSPTSRRRFRPRRWSATATALP